MSTLQVENLIGPTSGSNANKVIIPSGQTLDASNGFVAPSGHVIQVVSLENTTADSAVVSADYPVASGFKLSITPSSTNSKILVVFTIDAWLDQGSSTNKIGKYGIRLNSQSNTIVSHKRFGVNFTAGTAANLDVGASLTMTYLDSPNSTSAQEYELVLGRWSYVYNNNVKINGGGVGHSNITLMEIAQ
jgi:hypothetical protein